MRTLLRTIFVSMCMTMLFSGVYGTTPYIKVRSYDLKKFYVMVNNEFSMQVNVVLKDVSSNQVFSETANGKSSYLKGFDVGGLPDGQYMLEVQSAEVLENYSLRIGEGKLLIESGLRLVIQTPNITQDGNRVDVAMLKQIDTPYTISICNKRNAIIFEDTLAATGSLVKRYDMSKLDPGAYTMRIAMAGTTYSQAIKIQ